MGGKGRRENGSNRSRSVQAQRILSNFHKLSCCSRGPHWEVNKIYYGHNRLRYYIMKVVCCWKIFVRRVVEEQQHHVKGETWCGATM